MPITYHFDPTLNMLLVHASGNVTVEDQAEFVATALVDNTLPSKAPILIDVSELTNLPSSRDVPIIARLIELLAARFKSRIAYLVSSRGVMTPYALVCTYVKEHLASAFTFNNREEALRWLKN